MELKEFITNTLLKNNLDLELGNGMEAKIMTKAKEYLKGTSGAIDDDTIAKWVVELAAGKKEEVKKELPPRPVDVRKDTWAMDSLF